MTRSQQAPLAVTHHDMPALPNHGKSCLFKGANRIVVYAWSLTVKMRLKNIHRLGSDCLTKKTIKRQKSASLIGGREIEVQSRHKINWGGFHRQLISAHGGGHILGLVASERISLGSRKGAAASDAPLE